MARYSLSAFLGASISLALATLLVNCGKGGPAPAPLVPTHSSLTAAPAPVTPPPTTLPVLAELEGTWNTPCLQSPVAIDQTYYYETYVFSPDTSFTHTHFTYDNSGCSGSPTDTETVSGTYNLGAKVQARFARANLTKKHFSTTRGDAIAMELVINSPADSAGKKYTVERIDGQSLFMGLKPYSDEAEDKSASHVPSVDVYTEFHK